MTYSHPRGLRPAILTALLLLSACEGLQGPEFSQAAVDSATELRTESLSLLSQADEPFARHADDVQRVKAKAEGIAAGAKQVPGNDAVATQWQLMTDPDGNLLGGVLVRWEEQGTLSRVFRDEASAQVAKGFDIIICTEESKRQPKACGSKAAGGN
jgi:hypothetical protein